MKKNFLLLIILLIGLLGIISFFIIINYLDPYHNKILAIFLITISFILGITGIFTNIFFFIKKVYYRGNIELYHVKTSFRQAFFLSLYFIGLILLNYINAPLLILGTLLFIIFFLIELFIYNLNI